VRSQQPGLRFRMRSRRRRPRNLLARDVPMNVKHFLPSNVMTAGCWESWVALGIDGRGVPGAASFDSGARAWDTGVVPTTEGGGHDSGSKQFPPGSVSDLLTGQLGAMMVAKQNASPKMTSPASRMTGSLTGSSSLFRCVADGTSRPDEEPLRTAAADARRPTGPTRCRGRGSRRGNIGRRSCRG
jgi:hypothetical protein